MEKFKFSQHRLLLTLLRKVRTERGVTQRAVVIAHWYAQSDISKVERGVRRLDVLELRIWLSGLDLPLSSFVDELEVELNRHNMLVIQASESGKTNPSFERPTIT